VDPLNYGPKRFRERLGIDKGQWSKVVEQAGLRVHH